MKIFQHARSFVTFTVISVLLTPLPTLAQDGLNVFGDSLSDGGNVGGYTWDGGRYPLYDEILAAQLGETLGPC